MRNYAFAPGRSYASAAATGSNSQRACTPSSPDEAQRESGITAPQRPWEREHPPDPQVHRRSIRTHIPPEPDEDTRDSLRISPAHPTNKNAEEREPLGVPVSPHAARRYQFDSVNWT